MASFIVTTLADENDAGATVGSPGGNGLSLREALVLANGAADADTISFAAALAGQTLTITQGELVITGDVTIDGDAIGNDNRADITLDAGGNSRVFNVGAGTSTLDALVITGGGTNTDSGGGILVASGANLTVAHSTVADNHTAFGLGGGIYNAGTVTLTDSTVSDNSAINGGGIDNLGTLSATNTTLFGNHASNFGGGIYNHNGHAATLANLTLTGNSAAKGGGILNDGAVTMGTSIVAGNHAASAVNGPDLSSATGTTTFAGANLFSQAGITGTGVVVETNLAKIFATLTTLDPTPGSPSSGDEFQAGALVDNGGPVATVALAHRGDNPALDRGSDSLAPAHDARGELRVDVPGLGNNAGNTSDLGAFELQGPFETPSLVVTTLADVVDLTDGVISLREALVLANNSPDASTITFASNLAGGSIYLTNGELSITTDGVTINGDIGGHGTADITLSADHSAGANDANSRVLSISDGTLGTISAVLKGLVIRDGNTNSISAGAGIRLGDGDALALTNVTVSENASATVGGGIFVDDLATLTLTRSTVSGNIATGGGGIFGDARSIVTLLGSTISGNHAADDGGGIFGQRAAAIALTNSTVVGNSAGWHGGGIYGYLNNAITLDNTTVTGNAAGGADSGGDGGGIYNYGSQATTTLTNSIVAGNAAADLGDDLFGGNLGASDHADLVFNGGNIIGSAPANFATQSGAPTTQIDGASQAALATVFKSVASVDPDGAAGNPTFFAGVLANNGGPVQTVAIAAGGVAHDAGVDALLPHDTHDLDHDSDTTEPLPVDARGVVRVDGADVDIGAVEIQATPHALVVTTLTDGGDDDYGGGDVLAETADGGGLSLREALGLANGNPDVNVITFAPGLTGPLHLANGELTIATSLSIDGDSDGDGKADMTLDAGGNSRVFNVSAGTSTLDALVITGGGTSTDSGAGIMVAGGANLTVSHSTVVDNHTAFGLGGGIYNAGTVTLTDSTVSGNSALNGGGIDNLGTLSATNATLFGNHAGSFGGGIYNHNSGTATLANGTLAGNSAVKGGGILNDGAATIENSIVAGNHAASSANGPDLSSATGTTTFAGANLFAQTGITGTGVVVETNLAKIFANLTTVDPSPGSPASGDEFKAGALADNGGPVETIALAPRADNPALDRGDDTLALAQDARGELRADVPGLANNAGNASDLGAFELQGPFETPGFKVTTAADVVDLFDNQTSLREAIILANGTPGADTITFDPSLAGQTLFLAQGLLAIATDLTIDGDIDNNGTADITISADSHAGANDATSRVLSVTAAGTISATLNGLIIRDGNAVYGAGIVVGVADALTLTNSIMSDNNASSLGGAIAGDDRSIITLSNSALSGNSAGNLGGGILVDPQSILRLVNSTISGNTAHHGGGGMSAGNNSVITLTNSTLSGNHALDADSVGGGIFARTNAVVTLTNATVHGNSAGRHGGGIYGIQNNAITLDNTTVTGNAAGGVNSGGDGGGIFNFGSQATTTLTNSIVAGNTAADLGDDLFGGNFDASDHADLVFHGGNIIGSAPANFATSTGTPATTIDGASQVALATVFKSVASIDADGLGGNPAFYAGVLSNNGGPVQTVAIAAGGIAHDAGDDASLPQDTHDLDHDGDTAEPLPVDARGFARVDGAHVDIGAVETRATPHALVVTTLTDGGDDDYGGSDVLAETADGGGLSLREALALANGNSDVNAITFAPGLAGTLHLASGELAITTSVTIDGDIDGDGKADITIDAGGNSRVFKVGAGTSTLDALVITGGGTNNDSGAGIMVAGGANLTVSHSTLADNHTAFGLGGGIYNAGTVTLIDSTVSDNSALNGGGIDNLSTLSATNTTLVGNHAGNFGGGVYNHNSGTATLANATLTGNSATKGGGILNDGAATIENSIVAGNHAASAANGHDLSSATGTTTFAGANLFAQTGITGTGVVVETNLAKIFAALTTVDPSPGSPASGDEFQAGALADNGGPVATVALAARVDNPAVDGGDDGLGAQLDARGEMRADAPGARHNADNSSDLGAYELQGPFDIPSLVVTTLSDVVDMNDHQTSLREALILANLDPDASTITFASNLAGGTLFLTQGQLEIATDLTIDGDIDNNGTADITISADSHAGANDATGRGFEINDGTAGAISATLNGLVIRDGNASFGGGIHVGRADALALTNSTVTANTADHVGGGIFGYHQSVITLTNSIVSNNDAKKGGGLYINHTSAATISGSTLSRNSAQQGGGIMNYGTVALTDATLSGNTASSSGGGLNSTSATATLSNTTVADNSAGAYGGGIYSADAVALTLTNVTVSGNSSGRSGGGINSDGTTTLTNVTVTGNHSDTFGGGIRNGGNGLTLTNSIVAGNDATTAEPEIRNVGTGHFTGVNVVGTGADQDAGDHVIQAPTLGELFATVTTVDPDGTPGNGDDFQAGALANNGGTVQTIALTASLTNPALDASNTSAPATDALGHARVDQLGVANANGTTADLGAYELQVVIETPSLVVTTLNDVVSNTDGLTSLREALAYANSHAGADTITFAASLAAHTILLSNGELVIASDVTIDGDIIGNDNVADITIDGNSLSRVFNITAGTSTLAALTVTHGSAAGANGGAILNAASLTIRNSTITSSKTMATAGPLAGGGIYNGGTLTLIDSEVTLSTSDAGGGIANDGDLTLTNVTLRQNNASDTGGGLHNAGDATLTNVTFFFDSSTGYGGGIYNGASASVALVNATLSGNDSALSGGGMANFGSATVTNSILVGNGAPQDVDLHGTVTFQGTNLLSQGPNAVAAADIFDHVTTFVHQGNTFRAGTASDNGGPVVTIALKPSVTNAALDASNGAAPATDARGNARVDQTHVADANGTSADLGAYELQGVVEVPSLVVTTLTDVVDPFDGLTSLRESVAYANSHAGADTITFATGLAGGTIRLTNGQGRLFATQTLTIDGDIDNDGAPDITITGDALGNDTKLGGITDIAASHTADTLGDNVQIISTTADLTLDGLILTGGVTGGNGGAISAGKDLTLLHTIVSGNQSAGAGGGISANGTATLTNATVSGNSAGSTGGGLNATHAVLTNVTVSGNSAVLAGGGIHGADATLTNTTVSGNNGGAKGGGIHGTATLVNTIVLGNTATEGAETFGASLTKTGGNIVGTDVFSGSADVDDTTAAAVFANTVDIGGGVFAGVLADNGGTMQTIALKAGAANPALDASDAAAPATDALGHTRVDHPAVSNTNGSAADLGAFELQAVFVPSANIAPVNTVPATQEVEANTAMTIDGLSIADFDAASGAMSTTLSVGHGTLAVGAVGGAAVIGSGTSVVSISGTLAAINATLAAANNVVYTPTHDYFDNDALTVITSDNGNTGSGGPLTDSDQVTIHLNTHLFGTPGPDSFIALPGNERIDALGSADTITFGFRLVDASVTYVGNTVIIDGPSSHTVLSGFEVFNFTDGTVNNNDGNWLVDDLFYYSQNHDVWNAHADADAHYNGFGWHENRDPDAFFSTSTYLSANADVSAAGVNPLYHWHSFGWSEGRVPSIDFDPRQYLDANPDVAAAHVDPLAHFLRHGAGEGRVPFAAGELITANGFDYVYYLNNNPDVAVAHVDPFQHFQTTGWIEGRNPNALFDVNGYLATYTDVDAAKVNPLDHYNTFGRHEGRDPSVGFDTTSYLAAYADVAAAGVNPLSHFLDFGIHEGRSAFADGAWG